MRSPSPSKTSGDFSSPQNTQEKSFLRRIICGNFQLKCQTLDWTLPVRRFVDTVIQATRMLTVWCLYSKWRTHKQLHAARMCAAHTTDWNKFSYFQKKKKFPTKPFVTSDLNSVLVSHPLKLLHFGPDFSCLYPIRKAFSQTEWKPCCSNWPPATQPEKIKLPSITGGSRLIPTWTIRIPGKC